MALSPLTSSDAEALARDKLNQAIAEADKVGGIGAALAALQITLAPYLDLVGGTPNRPGDSRTLFTKDKLGSPKTRAPIDKGVVADGGELGQVLRISGADTDPASGYIDVSPRRAYYMRPGRAYLVRHAFARFQDPTDPEQNAVELRFQNLSASFGQVSNVRLGSAYAPAVTDGPYFVDTFIGKAGAPGTPSYVVPPSSAYGVPYFRVYGNGHQTDLGEVWLYDVSDALAGGADIASIIARVARLEVTQSANVIFATSWADLAGRTGRVAGAGAEVPDSDTGTHTDPITGAANTPNAGRYQWSVSPAGWRWVSLTTAKQAALFIGQGIPTVAANKVASLLFMGIDPATGAVADASAADFVAFIKGLSMEPPTFSSEPPGLTAELTSKVILPPDDQRKNFQVQCETHDLAVNWNGSKASFDKDAVVYAGVIPDWSAKGKEAVSVIARPSSLRTIAGATTPAKIWVSQDRLVPGYISGSLFGDTVLSNYPDQGLNKAYRGTLRDRINRLNDLGIWDKLTVVIFPVHTIDNLTVNLAKPSVPMVLKGAVDTTTVGKMTVVPYRNWGATGPAAYIDTGLSPASGLGLASDRHLMGVQIDGTALADSTGFAGNSSTYYIRPNAQATLAAFRSGGTAVDTIATPAGGWVMGNRIAADTYDLYGEGAPVAKPGTFGTPGERNLFICALNTSSGVAAQSALRARGFVHGFGQQTQGSAIEVRDAYKAVFAAADLATGA